MPTIVGHRVTGLTSCPGILLFRDIPGLRRAAAGLGLPKVLRPHESSLRIGPGSATVRIGARGTARLAWTVSIRTRSGDVVRTFHAHGKYLRVRWDGKDGAGHRQASGKYRVVIAGKDAAGRLALPAMLPVEVTGSSSSADTSFASPATTTVTAASPGAGGFRVLQAVTGTDGRNVWAVGGAMSTPVRGHALVIRRTPAGWRPVAIPTPGKMTSFLSGVAATSPADVWAVGFRCGTASCAGGGFGERTLIEHGTSGGWRAVASPNPGTGADRLNSVAAISPTDAWAVGDAFDEGVYLHQPLLEHWDGVRWTAVGAPRLPGVDVHMTDVLERSPSDVWTVGHGCLGNRGCGGAPTIRPVVLHYDGTRWRVALTARVRAAENSLEAIAASGGDLLAVGWRSKTRHSNSRPLGERSAGGRWRVESAPRLAGILFGADAARGAPAWAVGDRRANGRFRTLVVRRTRAGWKAVKSPSPPGRMSELSSISVLSRGNAWAVGPSVAGPFLLHWNGSRWGLVRPR
jgi:hypothetical protein